MAEGTMGPSKPQVLVDSFTTTNTSAVATGGFNPADVSDMMIPEMSSDVLIVPKKENSAATSMPRLDSTSHSGSDQIVSNASRQTEAPSEYFSVVSDLTSLSDSQGKRSGSNRTHTGSQIIHDSNVARRSLEDKMNPMAKLGWKKVGLVGRKEQIAKIKQTVQQQMFPTSDPEQASLVQESPKKQKTLLSLSGPSGVGKSALALQTLESILESTATVAKQPLYYSAMGKWSLTNTDEPLSILRRIFFQIGEQVQERDPETRQRILEEFQQEKDVLAWWMPALLQAETDSSSAEAETPPSFDHNQLRYVTTSLLATIDRPIAIVCDDIQWADPTSIALLKHWATDNSINKLLIIVTYRSDEVDTSHEVTRNLLEPLEQDDKIVDVPIGPLTEDQTEELLTELLALPSDVETSEFSLHVHKSTGGNPFYMVSFVQSLVDELLLAYNLGTMKWTWDLDGIKAATSVSDNVVDIVKNTLTSWSRACALLPVAATLGSSFEVGTLAGICSALEADDKVSVERDFGLGALPAASEIHTWLKECEDGGFLTSIKVKENDGTTFKFVHDRIQEAALGLLTPSKLERLESAIGRAIASQITDDSGVVQESASDYLVFTAVNLLAAHQEVDAVETAISRSHYAFLNQAAGDRSTAKSSFKLAVRYYDTAVGLLSEGDWREKREFCAKVYSGAAWSSFCAGDAEQMLYYADVLLSREEVPILLKSSTYHTKIQYLCNADRHMEGIVLTLELLEALGIRIPKTKAGATVDTLAGLVKSQRKIRRMSEVDIEKLPIAEDRKELAIARTLDTLSSAAYHGKVELVPIAALMLFNRTLKYGLTKWSAPAFSLLGLIMASGLEDFASTKSCYHLSIAAQKRTPSKDMGARLLFLNHQYLAHWFITAQNSLRQLHEAYRIGLMDGDIESGAWTICFYHENAMQSGRPLMLVHADAVTYTKQLKDYSMLKQKRYTTWTWQATRNLMGSDLTTSKLSGSITTEEAEMAHFKQTKDKAMELAFVRVQMFLAVSLGDYERCANIALATADEIVERLPSQPANIRVRFNAALSALIMVQRGHRKFKRLATKNAGVLRTWAKKGNPNCLHLDAFLDAEKARADRKQYAAIKSYESAVILSARQGFLHEQALANERYADLLFGLGRTEDALTQVQDAIKLYREWGAMSKVNQLESLISGSAR